MSTLGLVLFIIGSAIVFGSDRLYKRGKITDLKLLLIVKSLGLGITIAGVAVMIYGS